MIDPRDWKPEKPQCIHHNDADNCYACGTGKVSKGYNAVFTSTGSTGPVLTGGYKCEHGNVGACFWCDIEGDVKVKLENNRLAESARVNEISNRVWTKLSAKDHAGAWPAGDKCVHGMYVAEYYCAFCSIEIVEPNYDRNKYRAEINRALASAKVNFHAKGYYPGKDQKEVLTENERNFQDLLGLVDLEVWKASKHYGDEMNGAIAAEVAKRTAGGFTAEIIEDQTVVTNIEWAAMPSHVREDAFELFTREGGLDGLIKLSKNDRADAFEREFAKKILNEYGVRAPRSESMDKPTEFADGNDDGGSTSATEYELQEERRREDQRAPDVAEMFEAHREGLQALVRTWRGDLRKVGEAMLAGAFNVRAVPGVSKSTASRLYQKAAAAFRAHIGRGSNS